MEEKEVRTEPTVEQYKKMVEALKSQNAQLIYQIQSSNLNHIFKRLDYLFKVLENAVMFDEAFVSQCVDEIKGLMTPPKEEKTEE